MQLENTARYEQALADTATKVTAEARRLVDMTGGRIPSGQSTVTLLAIALGQVARSEGLSDSAELEALEALAGLALNRMVRLQLKPAKE